MPTIGSFSSGAKPTFLSNRIMPQQAPTAGLSDEQRQAMTQRIFNSRYQENRGSNIFTRIGGYAAASAIDLGDTLASNQLLPLADRGDVWNLVGDYGGVYGNELKNFYDRNTTGVELASGLVGAVGTAYVGGALLLPRISSAMAASTAISSSRLWQLGAGINAATRARVIAAQAEAAAAGEAFSIWRTAAGRGYLANRSAAMAGTAAFEEGLIGLTMNSNKQIWSDEMSDNLFWGALGIGVGGMLGGVGARFEMRRMANDPSQIKARADAMDPQGITRALEYDPDVNWLRNNAGVRSKESARTTIHALEARQAIDPQATPALRSRLEEAQNVAQTQTMESVQKIAAKGALGVIGSAFSLERNPIKGHIQKLLYKDPAAFHGLDSLGMAHNKPLVQVLKEFQETSATMMKSKTATEIQEGRRRMDQQALLLVDSTWMPASEPEALSIAAFRPGRTEFKTTQKGTAEFQFRTASSNKVRKINESFDAPNFEILPKHDQMQIIEGLHKVMRTMRSGINPIEHNVSPRATWFQLDAARYFESIGGKVNWSKAGLRDSEDALRRSLGLKADALKASNSIGSFWERLSYNLPLPDSSERVYDPAGDNWKAVLDLAQQGGQVADMESLRRQMRNLHGFDIKDRSGNPLEGSLFTFNRDEGFQWQDMAVGFFDNPNWQKPLTEYGIAEAQAERKAAKFGALMEKPQEGGFIPALNNLLHTLPEYIGSKNLRGLADDMITGVGNFVSQGLGEIITQEMRYRDNKAMLNLLRTREVVNRETNNRIRDMVKIHLQDFVPRLNAAPNAGSKVLVNQFASISQGWDFLPGFVPNGPNRWAFALAKTPNNEKRLGREVTKGETFVNSLGKEVVVDDLGRDYIKGFGDIAEEIRVDHNRIRKAMGLMPMNHRNHYMPSPNTKGMHVGFVFDANNEIVPGTTVIAKTRSEFETMSREAMQGLPAGYTFRTRESTESFADAYDKAQMEWMDSGVGPVPSRVQKGLLTSGDINPNSVADHLDWIKRQTEALGTGLMRTLYDSQLEIARSRGSVERAIRGLKTKGLGARIDDRLRTIWDEYESTVMGRSLGDSQRSISGAIMHPVESLFNGAIESVWPSMQFLAPSHVAQWTGDLMNRIGIRAPKSSRTFDELVRQIGNDIPFANATEYAEQTFKVSRPPEIREISQDINRLSATLLLRWFELPHAAMNLIGILTTMPSIARNGRAPISAFFNGSRGQKIGVLDTYKIMAQAMGDMTTNRRAADYALMVRNGDASQQVAEFNQQMAAIKDRGSIRRVLLGTGDKGGRTGIRGVAKERGIDGLISIASDTTENWSRTYSHFVGLRIADLHGITGAEARHSFAREIANSAIANYNPLNRPELYQSAFGSMYGLFMSWMQSYNQRLFRWMETGDYNAIGRQMAMQSTLFGLTSLPGYKVMENMLLGAGVGETQDGQEATLTDHIYAKFGPIVGSALAHGGIAETGVVLYTRGDMNYRDVTLDPTKIMAGLGVTGSAVSALKESIQSVVSSSALEDSGRLSEILARNMPNRALKGLMAATLNDGIDTDVRGQIVTENKDFFETALRITGLRSQRQQSEIEAFYANRSMQDREAARMDVLRAETRAAMRNPGWQENMQSIFDKYVKNGGRPDHFRTWIQNQVRASGNSRGLNNMQKALRNPKNHQEVWRYNLYGG